MTEEIIINGVNVAGCNAYKEGHCLDKTAILLCDTNKCSNYNDCYYKQLKRLEQENKTLNYQWHKQSEIGDEWYKIAEKYKSALEEIREIANDNNFCASYACPPMFKILDKINEVIGNETVS